MSGDNTMKSSNWSWKPGPTDRRRKPRSKAERKRARLVLSDEEFYTSREWRELRVDVIEEQKAICAMCGRSPKTHSVVIHVDHIKPRSKHPELELTLSNLQVLCVDCNLGKSDRYETDWR